MARNLLLLATSIVFALVCGEGSLRLVYEQPRLWRDPQLKHLRSPLLGWVLPSGGEFFSIDAPVTINSRGLRDDEIPREKPLGEARILALGDSFTFALGVTFDDLWVQQLQRRLNERHAPRTFQVINAAVDGYNTRQELIYLLSDGFSWQPDLVIVGFYWNDLVGNGDALPDLTRTTRLEAGGGNVPREMSGHTLPPWIRDRLRRLLVFYIPVTQGKALWQAWFEAPGTYAVVQRALLEGDSETLQPFWRETERRLLQISDACRERGIPVVLLVFPMENQFLKFYPQLDLVGRLREIWASTTMPFVDVEPDWRVARDGGRNPFLLYDQHPSPIGMQIAAERLYQTLLSARLLDL